ncbi:DNA polymerase beta domain protein region [Ferroglobus placidus DSM 10642]|uniref:DNA polymerase beta domain protein region n=1 Tax=Ferroglobus placidus (strain DSM 10642 / AEDII12DO) TaxID=589924 RepID=D3S0S7_FERPA|nr:nucleotidyltransferase domain-containing protein [Ferroglobus placidus]ADC66318.1 DNA polymerase beta domain protein region [Ferroglobus placidus DSM 10642]
MKVEKIVEEFARELRKKHEDKVEAIIFFGSHARSEGREESDIDVLIIGDLKLDEAVDVAYPIFLKYGVYISPIVMNREHFETLKAERTGFIENVLKEGVFLYGGV